LPLKFSRKSDDPSTTRHSSYSPSGSSSSHKTQSHVSGSSCSTFPTLQRADHSATKSSVVCHRTLRIVHLCHITISRRVPQWLCPMQYTHNRTRLAHNGPCGRVAHTISPEVVHIPCFGIVGCARVDEDTLQCCVSSFVLEFPALSKVTTWLSLERLPIKRENSPCPLMPLSTSYLHTLCPAGTYHSRFIDL
jgi:hypothetical protein